MRREDGITKITMRGYVLDFLLGVFLSSGVAAVLLSVSETPGLIGYEAATNAFPSLSQGAVQFLLGSLHVASALFPFALYVHAPLYRRTHESEALPMAHAFFFFLCGTVIAYLGEVLFVTRFFG